MNLKRRYAILIHMPKASTNSAKKVSHKRIAVGAKKARAAASVRRAMDAHSLVATKPLKGPEALDLLRAMGIVTPSGKLALAYS